MENKACCFDFEKEIYKSISSETLDLLKKLLDVNKETRISAKSALLHPYFDGEESTQNKEEDFENDSAMTDEKF